MSETDSIPRAPRDPDLTVREIVQLFGDRVETVRVEQVVGGLSVATTITLRPTQDAAA